MLLISLMFIANAMPTSSGPIGGPGSENNGGTLRASAEAVAEGYPHPHRPRYVRLDDMLEPPDTAAEDIVVISEGRIVGKKHDRTGHRDKNEIPDSAANRDFLSIAKSLLNGITPNAPAPAIVHYIQTDKDNGHEVIKELTVHNEDSLSDDL